MKRIIALVAISILFAGCIIGPKIDWPGRIGNYTYDEAVLEFGPPDKSAKLTDGMVVAEWLTQRGEIIAAAEPYMLPPGCYFGPATPMYSETYVPAQYLRLTFGADGKLKAWKKFAR